jgi:hypothetical protein
VTQKCSELSDWTVVEFSNSDSIAREVVYLKEDFKSDFITEEKAKAALLKKLVARLNDPEENDLQMTVLSGMATHIDALFSLSDREATVEIIVFFAYLELAKISPVIDGALVVQGTLLAPEFGPALCVVHYAADDEEDFHQLMVIPPWDMIIQKPEGDEESAGGEAGASDALTFLVPLELPDVVNHGDGMVQVTVYIDRFAHLPYDQMDDAFEMSPALFTSALKWTTRCLHHGHGDTEADDDAMDEAASPVRESRFNSTASLSDLDTDSGAISEFPSTAIMQIPTPQSMIVQEIVIVGDYDDLMAARAEGFTSACEVINTETGGVEEDQQHVWKFHVAVKYGPANGGGIEDIQFLKTPKSLGQVPELKGYTVFHDVDLTEVEDNVSVVTSSPYVVSYYTCNLLFRGTVFLLPGCQDWATSEIY